MDFEIENGVLVNYSGNEEHLVIPDGVVRINDNVFENHTEIRTVRFPDSLKEIGEEAFMTCTSLESIDMPDSVILADCRAFYECYALRTVRLSKNLTEITDQMLMETAISSIDIPDGVKSIGNGAFAGCRNLKSVTVPDSVEEIDVLAFGYESNWDTDSEKIEGFELRGSINSPARRYAHEYELSFVPVGDNTELPEFEIIDGVLVSYNGNSETVVIPDGVTVIGEYAFKANKTLRHVSIPDTVTEIGFYAFEDCEALEEVDIPGSVKEIVAYAFMRCRKLNRVKLNEGLKKIGTWAFGDCESLKSITIPDSVIKIGDHALGYIDRTYYERYGQGIPYGFVYRFQIHHNGNEATRKYIARHRLSMTLLRNAAADGEGED